MSGGNGEVEVQRGTRQAEANQINQITQDANTRPTGIQKLTGLHEVSPRGEAVYRSAWAAARESPLSSAGKRETMTKPEGCLWPSRYHMRHDQSSQGHQRLIPHPPSTTSQPSPFNDYQVFLQLRPSLSDPLHHSIFLASLGH